jgi:hypothetical protein
MRDFRPTALMAAALALAGDIPLKGLRLSWKPSRTNYAACDKEIPPGKPGWKCSECRGVTAQKE